MLFHVIHAEGWSAYKILSSAYSLSQMAKYFQFLESGIYHPTYFASENAMQSNFCSTEPGISGCLMFSDSL